MTASDAVLLYSIIQINNSDEALSGSILDWHLESYTHQRIHLLKSLALITSTLPPEVKFQFSRGPMLSVLWTTARAKALPNEMTHSSMISLMFRRHTGLLFKRERFSYA